MSGSKTKVLVVGAAGHFAGLVVPALAGRGVSVRGLVRDEKQGEQARRNGAAEVAIGDLRNRASIDAALRGVGAAFYIAPVYQKDEAQMGLPFVAAAKAAGVRRIVFSSAIHPVIGKLQNHIQKVPVEEAVVESGMEFTILDDGKDSYGILTQGLLTRWPGWLAGHGRAGRRAGERAAC